MTRDRHTRWPARGHFERGLLPRPLVQREKRWRRNPRHGWPEPPDQPWNSERAKCEKRCDAEEESETTTRGAAPAPVRARGGGYDGRTRHGRWEPNRASRRVRTQDASGQETWSSERGDTRRHFERPETTDRLTRPRTRSGSVGDGRSPLK